MDELLEALSEQPESADLGIQEAVQGKSPTALKLDSWSLRKGREVLDGNKGLRSLYSSIIPLPEDATDEVREARSKTLRGMREMFYQANADFHSAAFEPEPQLVEACEDERRWSYLKSLMETPEYQALHADTQLDECASELATASFAQSWVTLCQQEVPEDSFQKDLQSLRAASKALEGAKKDVGDLRDAQSALGLGSGAEGQALQSAELAKMFKKVRGDKTLQRICQLAGRYRRFAQAQQRKKVLHGRDDMVGVTLDGDPGRLLPHELAALDDPDLEWDAMRRIVERQAMCREYRGIEREARDPIAVVVDESGSMGGEPICQAKAIALALAWVARSQDRWCCLVGFSGGTQGNFLALPPGKWDQNKLLEWLVHFYDCGTDCDVPLVELPKRWDELGAPKGKTDIVVITDAILRVPNDVKNDFNSWKALEKVKMISLVIGHEPGDLRTVSDKVYTLNQLTLDEEGVGEALSI
jgi:uncharacterized protein with von Willebrand factor type A (vWA) domain